MASCEPADEFIGAFGNRSGPRSRSGCRTCRESKVKCDETHPICQRCDRLSRVCDWTVVPRKRPSRGSTIKSRRAQHVISPSPWPQTPPVPVTVPEAGDEGTRDEQALVLTDPTLQAASFIEDEALPVCISPRSLIPATSRSSCGLDMDAESHAAVYMYATRFAASLDTKHTAYSVPAVVLQTIANESAPMHMVLAIGRQHLAADVFSSGTAQSGWFNGHAHAVTAMEHYGEALSLLGGLLSECRTTRDLDVILATLWLTTVYEQRFGQRPMGAIMIHLQCAVSVLTATNITRVIQQQGGPDASQHDINLSYLGARLLVWLLGLDARATTFGHGGVLNSALGRHYDQESRPGKRHDWFRALSILYQKVGTALSNDMGPRVPDERNSLRLMGADIRRAENANLQTLTIATAQERLEALQQEHIDLFIMAAKMPSSSEELGHELTMTMCWVMPHYYASVLDILRASGQCDPEDPRRLEATQMVLRLAIHGYQQQGAPALVRVAWPVFMAALETPDPFQQQWAVDRLKELAPFGKCYHSAALLLERIQCELRVGDPRAADSIEAVWSGPFFI